MNAQISTRLTQIKQYINNLNDSISVEDKLHTSTVISRFKKSVLKSDPNTHTNLFVLQCLKARNQKLRIDLEEIKHEKCQLDERITTLKTRKSEIKESKMQVYITRLTISLSDSRKVEYQEVNASSDYTFIYLNSIVGKKYNNYSIPIHDIQGLELKANLLYLCFINEQTLHVIMKMKNEKEASKWHTSIRFALLAFKAAKKKERLFEERQEQIQSFNHTNLQTTKHANLRNSLSIPQIPFLNTNNIQNKLISPSESLVSQKKFLDKQNGQKSLQKNTQRSLVNAMNYQGNQSSGTFYMKDFKDPLNQSYSKRIDTVRPPNLIRLRGNSNNTEKNANQSHRMYKTSNNSRKQSEDIIKPQINLIYHEKMMEKYRSQQENIDDTKIQANMTKTVPSVQPKKVSVQLQMAAKIKALEEKKKQLLKHTSSPIEKHTFTFDSKVSWMGIQEMEDENKSKSSNRLSNKSRRGSEFSESVLHPSSDHVKKDAPEEDQSEHITEKSQEESPKYPKKNNFQVPQKISYANGIVFQLHPVQKSSNLAAPPSKDDSLEKNISYKSQSSSSDDSQQDGHSDPSSHENHTQSEDNNARSEQLKKGIILTKCSQNGFWTHEKIVYLSQNQTEICSRDLKDKKIKKVKLSNIKEVQYKKFDKGIIKHVPKIEEDKCLVIRTIDDDKKEKNLEFVGNLAQPLERFANNLKLFVQYNKNA